MLVKEVMSRDVLAVHADQSVKEALRLMSEHHVTALPVIDRRTDAIVGVVSEADLLRARVPHDPRPHITPPPAHSPLPVSVGQVMSSPMTVTPDTDLSKAVALMVTTSVKSLPVVEHGRVVVGMVSRSDVVHLLSRPDQEIRDQIADLLASAGLGCAVEVTDGIVSLLAPDDATAVPAMRAIADAVPGVISVQVFG